MRERRKFVGVSLTAKSNNLPYINGIAVDNIEANVAMDMIRIISFLCSFSASFRKLIIETIYHSIPLWLNLPPPALVTSPPNS